MIDAKDIGYRFTKSCFGGSGLPGDFEKDMFPTAVSKYIPQSSFGEEAAVIKVNGVPFAVGETALREGKTINTRTKDFVGSDPYFAILGHALERCACPARILVLGLPPGQFTDDYTNELTEKLRATEIVNSKGNLILVPPQIKWAPQGGGIFLSHVRNGGHADFHRKVVILDLGYFTFDKLFFIDGKFVKGSGKSDPLGVFEMYESIKQKFYMDHKTFLKSDDSCDKLIAEGKVEIAGHEYRLDVKSVLSRYISQVVSSTEEYIQNLPQEADCVVGGGGGIALIKPNGASKFNMSICSDSQLANAIGYYEYGRDFL